MIGYAEHGKMVDAGERSARAAKLNHDALDLLALALTNHSHVWTREQRKAYDDANKAYEESMKGKH